MTNNPDKLAALARHGITVVERVPLAFPSNAHNEAYLRAKAARAGHILDALPAPASPAPEPVAP
jgi:GTP cyclohydrolase II